MADWSTALGYIGAGMSDAGASLQGRSQDKLSAYAKYVEELKADKEYSAAEREWAKVSNFLMVNQFGSQEEAIAEIQKNPALMKSFEIAVAYGQKPDQRSQIFNAQMQETMTNLAKVRKAELANLEKEITTTTKDYVKDWSPRTPRQAQLLKETTLAGIAQDVHGQTVVPAVPQKPEQLSEMERLMQATPEQQQEMLRLRTKIEEAKYAGRPPKSSKVVLTPKEWAQREAEKQNELERLGIGKKEKYRSNLMVAAQIAGISPEKIDSGTMTPEEATIVAETYKKQFGTQALTDEQLLRMMIKPTDKLKPQTSTQSLDNFGKKVMQTYPDAQQDESGVWYVIRNGKKLRIRIKE